MKMEHISAIPIPEGTLQMAIIVKGIKDNQVFAYKAIFDDEYIDIFRFMEEDRITSTFDDDDEDDVCFGLSPKGEAALEAIESSFYSPLKTKGEK